MFLKEIKNKKYKAVLYLLIVLNVLAALKTIFICVFVDEEYQISMACRLLAGEKMLADLWDPHQMSAFLSEFFVWIYKSIFKTYDGCLIWVRFWGCMIHLFVSFRVFKVLSEHLCREFSFLIALLYFDLLPKNTVITDYANMFIWLVTLMGIELYYLYWSGRPVHTACSGLLMSLTVLSYPSAILFFPVIIIYLICKDKSIRNAGIFSLVCLICGGLYLIYLVSVTGSFDNLIIDIKLMLDGHSNYSKISYSSKFLTYAGELGITFLVSACYLVIAGLSVLIYRYFSKKKITFSLFAFCVLAVSSMHHILHWILMLHSHELCYNFIIYILVFALSLIYIKKVPDEPKTVIKLNIAFSFLVLLCVLVLTDQTTFSSFKYMYPGYIFALAGLFIYSRDHEREIFDRFGRITLLFICFAAVFVKGWQYPASGGVMSNVSCIRGIVKDGISKGVITDYMTSYIISSEAREIRSLVPAGSSLLVVDDSPSAYFFEDVNISSYTTICGAVYDETLLKYWEMHPDKYPDVIAVSCWYGDLHWDSDSWIIKWLEEDYPASQVIDGDYYRYYIL